MKSVNEKRNVQLHVLASEKEVSLIKERMSLIGVSNLSAYLRKVAIDGYIINLDLKEVRELIRLLRICSNNLNQYTRKANETGSVYAADIEDLRLRLDKVWDATEKMLSSLSDLP
jgi:hypothetical protein